MKFVKEIYVVVKEGGVDFEVNLVLCFVIEKVKGVNMLNENIDCVIKKVVGSLDGSSYEEIIYEGYGLLGIVVMVECVIDNKN